MTYHNVSFEDIPYRAVEPRNAASIDRVTVTDCRFVGCRLGAAFRVGKLGRVTISRNDFVNMGQRSILVGSQQSQPVDEPVQIRDNHIQRIHQPESDWHVVGIMSYVESRIIGNTIEDVVSQDRHEAVSSRGPNTIIRNNTFTDAGGHTAAVSLAGRGNDSIENSTTTMVDNVVRFTDDHDGDRDGIDVRQRDSEVRDNEIVGSHQAINFRRGGGWTVADNEIHSSTHQRVAIKSSISTNATIPPAGMGNVTIDGNDIHTIQKGPGEGQFYGILCNIDHHSGPSDPHQDDTTVTRNTFSDVAVADGSVGIHFENLDRPDTRVRGLTVEENDFSPLDQPITEQIQHAEDVRIANNRGYDE